MTFYRRRLPHFDDTDLPVFITWRLHGSLPLSRHFPEAAATSGQAFATMDRLLDDARSGPLNLRQPAIATMVVDAICHNARTLAHYELHAYAVMPNHVHLLITPRVALPRLTKSLKGITAKRANLMLRLTGNPFWQEESYDHTVRQKGEFEKVRAYIEHNPVRAGLVTEASEFPWSSTASSARPGGKEATGGSPADQGVRPTHC